MSAISEDIFINNLQVFYDMLNNNLGRIGFYQIMLLPDGTQKLVFISSTCTTQIGYSQEAVTAKPEIIANIISDELRGHYLLEQQRCFKDIGSMDMQVKCFLADGTVKWFHVFATTKVLADQSVMFNALQTDITESKLNEEKLLKNNRELELRNKISDRIATQVNLQELFYEVCHCLVEEGGYSLAWVALKPDEKDQNQIVHSIAQFGATDYVDEIVIDLADERLKNGPAGMALIERKTVIANNFLNDSITAPWVEAAKKYNIAASIVIPFHLTNDQYAALCIYSSRFDSFDEHEVEILEMIADSVRIAASNIQHKLQKEHSSYLLNERMKELQTMYKTSQVLQNERLQFNEKITQIVHMLPDGWQFCEDCVARIVINNKEFESVGYRNCADVLTASIYSLGKQIGYIEVGYLLPHPAESDGPFLAEERVLLDAVVKKIGDYYDKAEATSELLQSRANLSTIFKNTDVGYVLMDDHFTILSFNEPFQNGYANQSGITLKIGENFLDIIPEERRADIKNNLFTAIAKKSSIEYEVAISNRYETKYYSINIHPVVDESVVLGISFSAYDISTRKQEEIQQQKITHDMLQRNRDLEQFSYIVSHNIRAPLSNILGLTAGLKLVSSKEEEGYLLEGITQSAQILDNVIKDINYILQVNRTVFEEKEQLELSAVYEDAYAGIADLVAHKAAVICTDFSRVNTCYSIRAYLLNIFHNLIINSLKFSNPDVAPNISIWSELSDEMLIIHFRDNGLGIDLEKYANYMFGLYKRFHPHIQGKGMGLYIVKSQLQLLGGDISVSSVSGSGSEFIVYLPVA